MARKPWHESDSPERHVIGMGGLVAIGVAIIVLISAVLWGLSRGTSDIKGQADAYGIQNDAQNRMQSEAEFNQRYEDIQEYRQKIELAQDAIVDAQGREEDLDIYQEALSGAKNMCITAVSGYNALGGNPQKNRFRPANLPERLDSVSECKPSANAPTLAPSAKPGEPETGAGEPSPEPSTN